MAIVTGTWLFNKTPSLGTGSTKYEYPLPCTNNGKKVTAIKVTASKVMYLFDGDSSYTDVYDAGTWVDEGYRIIVFDGQVAISATANSWLTKSAKQIEPVNISYNGSVITSIVPRQTCTLCCSGKKATTDIAVGGDLSSWVTYNGKKTPIGQGKMATLNCGGKKMLSDVEVEAVEGFYTSSAIETTSATTLTASVDCAVGDLVVVAIATRDTLTVSNGWTLISTSKLNSTDTYKQRLSWAWKFAESTTESITVTQASTQRLYINMVALQGATGVTDNGYSYRDDDTSGSLTVSKPNGLVLWGMTTALWGTVSPYTPWTASNDIPIIQLGTDAQQRLGLGLDQTDKASVTFTSGATAASVIVGCLSVQGMDYFY